MTKAQIEVITSVQRRRRWSRAEKEWIIAAAMEPGAVASEVVRAAGIYAPANCSVGAGSSVSGRKFQRCSMLVKPVPEAVPPPLPEKAGVIEIARGHHAYHPKSP